MIPFNKPFITGKEINYILDAVSTGHLSGNGKYTKLCQSYFENSLNVKKALLTTSCTDALEMAAILLNIKSGDEVIIPSFTFVSTALAFIRQGAKIIFADSRNDHPGMDENSIEALITEKTKAIVPVHYAGVSCDMDLIMKIARKYNLFVVEDAAQAIDSFYNNQPLGSIGTLGCFSFHETKNIQCGEGGLLIINDEQFLARSEIIWEKGTNRAQFFRGEVNKYGWVDIGSSFLPSDISAGFLYAQIEDLISIQSKRKQIWNAYFNGLKEWANYSNVQMPFIPSYASNNGHMFYIVCPTLEFRNSLITYLKENNIYSVFHYQSLHKSEYFYKQHDDRRLEYADKYSDCLLRLPFFYDLNTDVIIKTLLKYEYNK